MARSEFLTPYTPYQPEISQGGLQVMFEFQTAISELTALPVSNASVYEGPSAVAAAAYLAKLANGRAASSSRAACTRTAARRSRPTRTATGSRSWRSGCATASPTPTPGREAIDGDTSAVVFQQPNFLGAVEDVEALAAAAKASPAVVIGAYDPIPLGILKPPGRVRRRHRRGGGAAARQPAGLRRSLVRLLRRDRGLPAPDARPHRRRDDRRRRARGFVLTLQTREQHIRREKATSNICTAQALNALGRRRAPGLAGPARARRAGRAAAAAHGTTRARRSPRSTASSALHEQPVVREFAVALAGAGVDAVDRAAARPGRQPRLRARPRLRRVRRRAARRAHRAAHARRTSTGSPRRSAPRARRAPGGGGVSAQRQPPARRSRHRGPRARTGRPVAGATPLQRDRADDLREGRPGPPRVRRARARRPRATADELLPAALPARAEPPRLPEVTEPELVRHYVNLSQAQLRPRLGLLPARLVHDEAQPAPARARRGAARPRAPAPAAAPRARAGRARADVEPRARARRDRRPAARLAAAQRRLARRAGRRAADARLPRGPRRARAQGPHARHRARHEPGDGDDGRLRGRQGRHERRRRRRPRRPAREGRRATSPA